MKGSNERQPWAGRQPLAIQYAATRPRPIAADADIPPFTPRRQGKPLALLGNPGGPHRASFAKSAAAFFMSSSSRLSRPCSARSLDISISSGVTTLLPAPFSLPSDAAFIQLPRGCSLQPRSLTRARTLCPLFTRFTASSLTSAVFACFGNFSVYLPKVTSILPHPW